MRKFFLTLCLGLSLLIFPFCLITSLPAMAAVNSEMVKSEVDLQGAIDSFLTSLPKDYYTVMKIDTLKNIVKKDNAFLIDVRQPSEYASGHIPNAINIPLQTLTTHLDKIPKNRPVILYCTTGYRSALGVMSLRILGYTNIRAFPPSIQGWKAAGETLEK
ncbi:rhodanese-like domain-containing protein [Floridanema evergladense]|uniref:Rhodanese-like domain-containing protein n=1 Tax=Floridaenema evergladense BLCC-F167 TaxID=3153639 RepID=A0ABV4WMY7_9CYAN